MLAPDLKISLQKPLFLTQLTALWALNEAVLGGVLHGLTLPITGLTVGSIAVLIVCLMGYYGGRRTDILKATLIVCIIKAMLSPHTPLPAYIAVLFQGVVGSLLVSGRGIFTLRCIAFGIVALLESALQKLLMLTIIFGVGFWEAVNQFIGKLLKQIGAEQGPYTLYIVLFYLSLHALAGLGIGVYAGRLPVTIQNFALKYPHLLLEHDGEEDAVPEKKGRASRRVRPFLLMIWIVLAILLVQAWLVPKQAWLPAGEAMRLIIRSMVVVLGWYLVVGPVLLRLFKQWLARKQGSLKVEVQAVLTIMPTTLHLARRCWTNASSVKGVGRIRIFLRQFVVNLFPLEDGR